MRATSIRGNWTEILESSGMGAYVYGLGKKNELRLEARSLMRRWSVHSGLVELGKEKRSGREAA
jgi:hypothetical protein